jgi:predicted metal-dependent hydrolase
MPNATITPSRDIKVRHVDFRPAENSTPTKYFVADDPFHSHLLALGSGSFPEGEDFFVRSVRAQRDKVTDPELARQVKAFIGQEALHGREHRKLNSDLAALGYPIRKLDRRTRVAFKIVERITSPKVQLALTAAQEHYTATLAEVLMANVDAFDFRDDRIRDVFLWHAIEESEHKAVAFDVYQAVFGDDRTRIRVMRITTFQFLFGAPIGLLLNILADPEARRPRRLVSSLRGLRHSPFFASSVGARLRAYNHADFHPDQHETSELLERTRSRLFPEESGKRPEAKRSERTG